MMPAKTALLVGLALAAVATNPKTLGLRASDFPAGTKVGGVSSSSGPGGSVYSASFNFKVGGSEEEVTDKVWFVPPGAKSPTPGLVGGVKATYASEAEQISGFRGEKALSLPRYGDQQTANWADYKNSDGVERARAALVVLKGHVVWTLVVERCGLLAPYGCSFGPTPPKITRAQAVAELEKYAAKLKVRVGGG
jgi:hypothetical protein